MYGRDKVGWRNAKRKKQKAKHSGGTPFLMEHCCNIDSEICCPGREATRFKLHSLAFCFLLFAFSC